MKLENIRENFSFMQEEQKGNFFLNYFEKRKKDLEITLEVKTERSNKSITKKANATLKVTPEQLSMLKLLGLA